MVKKKIVIILLISILALSFTVGCSEKSDDKNETVENNVNATEDDEKESEASEPLKIGDKAINFTLEDLEGNNVSLEDYKGKIVLLNFWATT